MASIIIRLQNLPLEANSLDIRRFFQGLQIPDGGVHIVGGDNGDAFIAFANDEDARQGMARDGNLIKGSKIKLLLSSRNEMQRVIENARNAPATVPAGGAIVNGQNHQQQPPPSMTGYSPYNQIPPNKQQPSYGQPNHGYGNNQQQQAQQSYSQPPLQQFSNDPFGRPPASSGSIAGSGPRYARQHSRSRSRSPPLRTEPTMHGGLPLPQNQQSGGGGGFPNGSNGMLGNAPPGVYNRQTPNNSYGYNRGGGTGGPLIPQQAGSWGGEIGNRADHWTPSMSQQPQQPQQQQQQQQQQLPSEMHRSAMPPNRNEPYPPVQYNQPSAGLYGDTGSAPMQQQRTPIYRVQITNLPLAARKPDIINFFAPLNLYPDNVKIFFDDNFQPTGLAQVTLNSPREYELALEFNNRLLMGQPINLRPEQLPESLITQTIAPSYSMGQLDQQQQQQKPGGNNMGMDAPVYAPNYDQPSHYETPNQRPSSMANMPVYTGPSVDVPFVPTGPAPGNKDLVMFMKGLPYNQCTQRDVAAFFCPITLAHIEIEMERSRPTGNAFVEFLNEEDFSRAMDLDHKHMGHRYIELIPYNRLNKTRYPFVGPIGGGRPAMKEETFPISVQGFPPHIHSKDLKQILRAEPVAVHTSNGEGRAFFEFSTQQEQHEATRYDGTLIDGHTIRVTAVSFQEMLNVMRPQLSGNRPELPQIPPSVRYGVPGRGSGSPDRFRSRDGPRRERDNSSPPSRRDGAPPFSQHEAILVLRDIPKRATHEDIKMFFRDFGINHERIRRVGPHDAKISFYNAREAERAHRTMSRKYFLEGNARLEFLADFERKKKLEHRSRPLDVDLVNYF